MKLLQGSLVPKSAHAGRGLGAKVHAHMQRAQRLSPDKRAKGLEFRVTRTEMQKFCSRMKAIQLGITINMKLIFGMLPYLIHMPFARFRKSHTRTEN